MMGLPENGAKHALYNTGNTSADLALGWYFEHQDDPSKIKLLSNNI